MTTTKCPHCAGELLDEFVANAFLTLPISSNAVTAERMRYLINTVMERTTYADTYTDADYPLVIPDISIHEGKP